MGKIKKIKKIIKIAPKPPVNLRALQIAQENMNANDKLCRD